MRFLVLGCGNIGSVIARDLIKSSPSYRVTIVDLSEEKVKRVARDIRDERLDYMIGDATNPDTLKDFSRGIDVIINALPGSIGYKVMKNAISIGVNLVDVSYMPENPLSLDQVAKERNITIIPDAGFAPGISNILIGYASLLFDKLSLVRIYVGGLPQEKIPPLNYCLTWSAEDLIEEYTRPARIIKNGKIVEVEALSGLEKISMGEVGELEAFYTDGLRTLLYTIKAENMEEKTLRYPGHVDKILLMKQLGLFDDEELNIDGQRIIIKRFTARLLEQRFACKDVKDLVILRVLVRGTREGKELEKVFELIDYYDDKTGITAMGRTTGFTASIIAQLLAQGIIREKGVIPPEYLGRNMDVFQLIISELSKRGIRIIGVD
ncbi:MAG: saccharopine dehydrogenase C-terminal domain-containing protein [Candidatus Njordarchaeales archaeon]